MMENIPNNLYQQPVQSTDLWSDSAKPPNKKLRIMIVVIVVLLLSLVGLGLTVGMKKQALKQDKQTYDQAVKIAKKLNSYVASHNTIPGSLAEAKGGTVPNTITYHRLSAKTYEFCVNYRAKSAKNSSSVARIDKVTVYIDSSHQAGKNCQTVEPYLYAGHNPFKASGNVNPFAAFCQYSPAFGQLATKIYKNCIDHAYHTETDNKPLNTPIL